MAKGKAVKGAESGKDREGTEAGEKPRGFGGEERVEKTMVDPKETDIFEEVLKGPAKQAADELKTAIDRNEEGIVGEDSEDFEDEDDEDDDEDTDDTESGDEAAEPKEEIEETPETQIKKPVKKKPIAPVRKKRTAGNMEDAGPAEKKADSEEENGHEGSELTEEQEENAKDDDFEFEEGDGGRKKGEGENGEAGAEGWDDDEFDYDIDHDAKEPEEIKATAAPPREEIRKTIIEKAAMAAEGAEEEMPSAEKLSFLADKEKNSVFIGRKASLFKRYGYEGALQVGRVLEKEFENSEVYLDSLNPHVVFVCGSRGSGKCLAGDTLITLDNGEIIPIKDLETRNEKVFALGSSLNMEAAARTEFFRRTVGKTLKVRLQSGKEIELTPEHPLLTVNGWRPTENLSVGDRIATPRVLPAFGNRKMKECDVKLLAYLIAEGHLSNQFVLFSNIDKKIIAEFKQSVVEFDTNLRIEQHSKPGCFRVAQVKKKVDLSCIVRDKANGRFTNHGFIKMEKSSIRQWLESMGLYGKLSAKKFIPKEVMQLEKGQLAVFLNRLFSCDGSIYRVNKGRSWCAAIGFSSERMTKEVQHLLLRFGILSTFRRKKTKCNGKTFDNFETVIYGENVIRFVTEIGFFGPKEERAAKAFEEMTDQKRNPNFDTVPKEIWKTFRVSNGKDLSRKLGHNQNWFCSAKSYAPSREKLLKIAQIEQNIGIQVLANSDVYWDTIKEITEILEEKEVYDITVPMHHNFVANDIIVHNSYVLGVIAEELAEKNRNVGTIVVDPVGVFWSMRFPNKDEKEKEKLREWGLEEKGLSNLKVFIPEGMKKEVPKSTYDAGFSIPPSLLTGEDWALTFGVDRFSVSGLLLEKALKKAEKGYVQMEPESGENAGEGGARKQQKSRKIEGKGKNYSLEDLIKCLETDSELNSRDKGYKQDSIRAIVSRFEAAKNWGIFNSKGTPLGELSREGQLTVLDTSFLEDNVTALVIGILARRLLAARKISTRKEAANKFKELDMNELLELEVPPTWLFIDEAHTLIPSGNEVTPATAGLIEYVKQGRRPGLSLVFATQQPSAINTKVLSQLDVIITHKLIFDDDIKAVFKRTPTIIPRRYRAPNFIKTLPVGVALTGDRREETSRAFVMGIRPRKSQHEGRDAETTQMTETFDDAQVESIAVEMLLRDLKVRKRVDIDKAKLAVDTLNIKYRSTVDFEKVLAALAASGIVVGKAALMLAGLEEMPKAEERENGAQDPGDVEGAAEESYSDTEERVESAVEDAGQAGVADQKEEVVLGSGEGRQMLELLALPARVDEEGARRIVEGVRKKGFLGVFGNQEHIGFIGLKYLPIWRVKFESMTGRKEFISRECFVNSMTGEFMHFRNGDFVESSGLSMISSLGDEDIRVLMAVQKREMLVEEIMAQASLDEARALRVLQKLTNEGIVAKVLDKRTGKVAYTAKQKVDLPPNERHDLLGSLAQLPFVKAEALSVEREEYPQEGVAEALKKLWGNIIVKKIEPLYKPVWHIVFTLDRKERIVIVDAVTGKILAVHERRGS